MATTYDNIDADLAKVKSGSTFPTVYDYYGQGLGQEADAPAWRGGEMFYFTTTAHLFIQTETSGTTATWKTITDTFATTTSTSTSTSSTTSSSTSTTTSSSSSTSTSTSSSSSTSTSTSTSSTTTA